MNKNMFWKVVLCLSDDAVHRGIIYSASIRRMSFLQVHVLLNH